MPEDEIRYIKKIQLSDGSVHWIKDSNALPLSGGTLTGDLKVDTLIKTNKLFILNMEVMVDPDSPTNVLVEDEGEIKKRSTDLLLKDIGGYSANFDSNNGILELKLGK